MVLLVELVTYCCHIESCAINDRSPGLGAHLAHLLHRHVGRDQAALLGIATAVCLPRACGCSFHPISKCCQLLLVCVQLLGLDYLIDDNMHPWLLEVNGTPSLAVEHGDTPVEQLIHDTKVFTEHGTEEYAC